MPRIKPILLSLLLTLPVIFFLLHHYFYHAPELNPTGFTVDENVLYMSYAHQYLDSENFSLFYSNPFDGDPASPKIYFQPVNFLFAAAMKTGADPGLFFSVFGLLMAIACVYAGIKIIRHLLVQSRSASLVSTLFTWGGGLTAIAGLIGSSVLTGSSYSSWLDGIFLADPANGWWGLNWGRNLFIPLEAYYHFLFLLNIYLLLKKRWKASVLAAFFLSISHPFTGIEYLLTVLGWLLIEKLLLKNKDIPYWYLGAITAIMVFHSWYYLVWLNNFPEHRELFAQYSAGWTYSLLVAIPAYCLVGALSILAACKYKPLSRFLSFPHQRLFLCWAIIAFLLSKHEWFIKPMQPIHFTRGYIWAGLFLLSLPGLSWLIEYLQQNKIRKWLLAGFIIIFLSDNILWTLNLLRKKETVEWEGHISGDTRQTLRFLKTNALSSDLLTGNAPLINYLANVYTPANAWVSHPYNTPKRQERNGQMSDFLLTGIKPAEWGKRRVWLVVNKKSEPLKIYQGLTVNKLFENNTYIIFTP